MNILEAGLPLPDNSVDAIFHEDFSEHLDQKEQILFLAEALRVLKHGLVHRINTPRFIEIYGKTFWILLKAKTEFMLMSGMSWIHKNMY